MQLDSDMVLIGTGLAPLVAAQILQRQGKTVLVLNPEHDFFGEDSEFSFDPLFPWRGRETAMRIRDSESENVLREIQPEFPGSIEVWPGSQSGFRDVHAPYVRTRNRLVLGRKEDEHWPSREEVALHAMDRGGKVLSYEGWDALKNFPGVSANQISDPDRYRALIMPKLADVDSVRYRNGVREFVRERLGPERVVASASPIEFTSDGVRFRKEGRPILVRVGEGVLTFWTPKLTSWILSQASRNEIKPTLPKGIRIWEHWSLLSKDPVDPHTIGMFEDLTCWAEGEGNPIETDGKRLGVLRPGPLYAIDRGLESNLNGQESVMTSESFDRISELCDEVLKWGRFTLRSLKLRQTFEWEGHHPSFVLFRERFESRVVTGAEGFLADVVRTARIAAMRFLEDVR